MLSGSPRLSSVRRAMVRPVSTGLACVIVTSLTIVAGPSSTRKVSATLSLPRGAITVSTCVSRNPRFQ